MSKRPNVVSFIRGERKAGKSDEQIRHDLLDAGWQIDIINHALEKEPTTPKSPQPAPSHFTKYSDWYTKKLFVYGMGVLFVFVLLLAIFG